MDARWASPIVAGGVKLWTVFHAHPDITVTAWRGHVPLCPRRDRPAGSYVFAASLQAFQPPASKVAVEQ
jgi:hypothetical protein